MRSACRSIVLAKKVNKKTKLSKEWTRFGQRNPMRGKENDCYRLFVNRKAKYA